MQHFFIFFTSFLGLIVLDLGPVSRGVLGKATPTSPLSLLDKPQGGSSPDLLSSIVVSPSTTASPLDMSPKVSSKPPKTRKPQSLAQVQNDASHLSMEEICSKFTTGSHSEFYSPLYPNNYAPEIDCYKIISAGPGQVIKIKFLDHFHLETEDHCNYDFLEIRDGRFGYSTVIQKVCGTFPPPTVQSSGRHLWLRFHSDYDIEYIGFKAVYEFVPASAYKPDLEECALIITKLDDYISPANISQEVITNAKTYEAPIDCTWMIHAGENEKIQITFDKYELEKPNDCTYNFIEIYGSQTELTDDSRMKQYCGSKAESISSKSNILYIRFFSMIDKKGTQELKSNFEAYYSFFRDRTDAAPCRKDEDEFDCTDNTCIDKSLRCNAKTNCKLRNDEENCPKKQTGDKRYDIPVIASIGCVLILGMCGGLFLNIFRKLRQDRKDLLELKEVLRKSHESILAMQMQGGVVLHGSSPHISSHGSGGGSKQTVFETSANGINGHVTPTSPPDVPKDPEGKENLSNGGAPPPLHNNRFRLKAESASPTIPSYIPPPPYVSALTSPRIMPGRIPPNSCTSNNNNDDISKELSSPQDAVVEANQVCIEVRDSACQTKESFLAQQRSRRGGEAVGKAPLAENEILDVLDLSTSTPSKRLTRPKPQHFDFPSHLSVSSTTSSTDLAERETPTGSLEDINE